jgi:hypothetical protein
MIEEVFFVFGQHDCAHIEASKQAAASGFIDSDLYGIIILVGE